MSNEDELDQLRTENEILKRELDGLAYGISHDLRDPLRTIIGYSGLLSRSLADEVDERSAKMLDQIVTNSEQLNIYVESMLQYSRLSRRELHPIDLSDLERTCRRAADTASGERPQPALELEIRDLPAVRGDAALIEQIFTLLLDNTIRFADSSRELKVEISGRSEAGKAYLTVKDNGIGFTQDQAEDIFTLFGTVAGKDPTNAAQGVGLAMALRIALRHGGWIRADGHPGRGAEFTVCLPALGEDATEVEIESTASVVEEPSKVIAEESIFDASVEPDAADSPNGEPEFDEVTEADLPSAEAEPDDRDSEEVPELPVETKTETAPAPAKAQSLGVLPLITTPPKSSGGLSSERDG